MRDTTQLTKLLNSLKAAAPRIFAGKPDLAVKFTQAVDVVCGTLLCGESKQSVSDMTIKTFEQAGRPNDYDDRFAKLYTDSGFCDLPIRGIGRAVFLELVLRMGDSNLIWLKQTEVAEALGISRMALSGELKNLKERDFIRVYPPYDLDMKFTRNDGTIYMINPYISCKRAERSVVFKAWDQINQGAANPDLTVNPTTKGAWSNVSIRSRLIFQRSVKIGVCNGKTNEADPATAMAEPAHNTTNDKIDEDIVSRRPNPMQAEVPHFDQECLS